jgi:hypothetical protein
LELFWQFRIPRLGTSIKSGRDKLVQCSNHIVCVVVLEYEYVGCFVDGWIRVLDGEKFKHQENLSANICNTLCNSDKHGSIDFPSASNMIFIFNFGAVLAVPYFEVLRFISHTFFSINIHTAKFNLYLDSDEFYI